MYGRIWKYQPKKKKKKKEKKSKTLPVISDSKEMDSELLNNNNYDNYAKQKLRGFNISPYISDNNNILYQNPTNKDTDLNMNTTSNNTNNNNTNNNTNNTNNNTNNTIIRKDKYNSEEQFNELLLYILTGLFIIILFDKVYKLGKSHSL